MRLALVKKRFSFHGGFERTTCQDIYRAGDGCHAEWLEIRSKTEPFYKRLSFKINSFHISLLNIESAAEEFIGILNRFGNKVSGRV